MADRSQVTSVEAIESFRADLIVYLSKARPTVEEVGNEVMRTRLWLQNDQRIYWDRQLKQRGRELERAQAELFGARLSKLQEATAAQQLAVTRARRGVREAEDKLSRLRKWNRELENQADPLLKQVDQLHGFLIADMAKAVAYLVQVVKTLEAYADIAPPAASPAPANADAVRRAAEQTAAPPLDAAGPSPPKGDHS